MTRYGICEDCYARLGKDWQESAAREQAVIENQLDDQIAAGMPIDWASLPSDLVSRRAASVILTTGLDVPGRTISAIVGVVGAESALGMNIFRDGANVWRDVFGGRSDTIQNALRLNRETCMKELQSEALRLGANAVIAIDLDYSEFSSQAVAGGMLFTAATGTAVRLD